MHLIHAFMLLLKALAVPSLVVLRPMNHCRTELEWAETQWENCLDINAVWKSWHQPRPGQALAGTLQGVNKHCLLPQLTSNKSAPPLSISVSFSFLLYLSIMRSSTCLFSHPSAWWKGELMWSKLQSWICSICWTLWQAMGYKTTKVLHSFLKNSTRAASTAFYCFKFHIILLLCI